jgi:transcriptional regulator of arginine metabolism
MNLLLACVVAASRRRTGGSTGPHVRGLLVMRKAYRQAQILKLIRSRSISTQEDLAEVLAGVGVDASQVTLSRDIRELGLVKSAAGYREPLVEAPAANHENLRRVLQEFLRDVRVAQNLVVLRTVPGGAQPVARTLDTEGWPEIVGTVAGDDTIFIAAASGASAKSLRKKLMGFW